MNDEMIEILRATISANEGTIASLERQLSVLTAMAGRATVSAVTQCPWCGCMPAIPEGPSWTFLVPRQPKSQNTFKGMDRHAYARERNEWCMLLVAERLALGLPPRPPEHRRRVVIQRRFGGRHHEMDRANLVGGCKPIVDALVDAGFLFDDSPSFLDDHYQQVRTATDLGLRFTIYDLGAA